MDFETQLTYTPQILKKACVLYAAKRTKKLLIPLLGFALVASLAVYIIGLPTTSFFIGIALYALFLGMLTFLLSAVSTYLSTKKNLKHFGENPSLTLSCNQTQLQIITDLSQSSISWKLLHHAEFYKENALLFFNRGSFFILPLNQLTQAQQDFIKQKCQENNVKIS